MSVYEFDGLWSIHNHEFMDDPAFKAAYARGVEAAGQDYRWYWRVHIGLFAARVASLLPGDFVECGVNRGFLSSAIMHLLDWDTTGRMFHLMDTFAGPDPRYVSEEECAGGTLERAAREQELGFLVIGSESVRRNFAQWRNVSLIEGPIPETLCLATPREVAFLHIDMNCAPPETAALEHFWGRLTPGAPVLLDDYAYHGYRPQKIAIDAFAQRHGVAIAALPTGQGLILKPASAQWQRAQRATTDRHCHACGDGRRLPVRPVLWRSLIEQWQLSPGETEYIDRQQGECCAGCGANLRSSVLAKAILSAMDAPGPLAEAVSSPHVSTLRVLEINEAGTLSPLLRRLPGHVYGAYPSMDMHSLPFPDQHFDLVIHSDTLEHVDNPVHALSECARVLKPGGAICYTVPVVVGRLSRSRAGLSSSHHGNPAEAGEDLVVRTEFGADFWTLAAEAGLSDITIHTLDYPATTAITARR